MITGWGTSSSPHLDRHPWERSLDPRSLNACNTPNSLSYYSNFTYIASSRLSGLLRGTHIRFARFHPRRYLTYLLTNVFTDEALLYWCDCFDHVCSVPRVSAGFSVHDCIVTFLFGLILSFLWVNSLLNVMQWTEFCRLVAKSVADCQTPYGNHQLWLYSLSVSVIR